MGRLDPGALLTLGLPAVAALAAGLWRLSTPVLWQDETATIEAARLPLPQLAHLVRHVDLVHAAYYLFMHAVIDLLGVSTTTVRLPSVAATVLAATGTAAIGRRLHSNRAGLLAGLIYTMLPAVSQYAQEARPYAIISALAVLTTHQLIRAIEQPTRTRLTGYAVTVLLLGTVNILAGLLLQAAHAATILTGRRSVGRWSVTMTAVLVLLVPLILLDHGQTIAVAWVPRPHIRDFGQAMLSFAGSAALVAPITALATLGCQADRTSRPGVLTVALPWFAVPVALLFAGSQFEPYYVFRYLVFCEPAIALLAGAGLARFRPPLITAALAAILVLSYPPQVAVRLPDAKGPDTRQAFTAIQKLARTGDAVAYIPSYRRTYAAAYPRVFDPLHDVALKTPAGQAGAFGGQDVGTTELTRRLHNTPRVWVLRINSGLFPELTTAQQQSKTDALADAGFVPARQWRSASLTLTLYIRVTPKGE